MLSNKIAICLWVYHTDLWDEFLRLLKPSAQCIKLYLGLCTNNTNNKSIIQSLDKSNIEYEIKYFSNYGADIFSFINQLSSIREDIFIKLHTKKSTLGQYGQINWRAIHLASLIQDQTQIIKNIKILNHKNTGMICNKHFILSNQEHTNNKYIYNLCDLFNIDYLSLQNKTFSAGTMFMSFTQIFQKYIDNHIDALNALLIKETNKVSDNLGGTYCHAMERIFGYMIEANRQKIANCNNLPIFCKLQNSLAKKNYFQLIKLYNNECYINEDINLYGSILDITDNTFTIQWKHRIDRPIQKYRKISKNIAIKYV